MAIKHDASISEGHTSKINNSLGNIKNTPKSDTVSYSNLYGVTKGVKANDYILDLVDIYRTSSKDFTSKINQVSKKFEEMDNSVKFGE